jgi:glycosyltransferase involved in cell wall biosynthesis
MKIAVNTRVLLKDRLEGVGWFIYEVFRNLAENHPEHEFIFFFDRPYHPDFVFGKNVTPVVLFPQARHPLLFVWWFEWSVSRALKRYKADVFISPDNFLCLNTQVPTLLVVHDLAYKHFSDNDKWVNRLYYRFFMPKFIKKATHIVTVSKYVASDLSELVAANLSAEMRSADKSAATGSDKSEATRISVAYNGCRKEFAPLSTEAQNAVKQQYTEGVDFFLFVGAVHPRKNVHRLIDAFDTFKKQTNSPMKLVICGRFAWQTGVVKTAFDKAYFKKDIIFTGYTPNEDVPKLTASAFAVVYTSLFEGFGLPILEALNCDTPVITSNVSSMPEVASDAALLVNPESVSEITEALQKLVENPKLRQDLIEKGRIQRQKFSWEKTADVVYQSLMKM